jgi:hypothetical protein
VAIVSDNAVPRLAWQSGLTVNVGADEQAMKVRRRLSWGRRGTYRRQPGQNDREGLGFKVEL